MPDKRVMLMYISEVSGHRSAAIAIEKALKILRPATQTLNINAFNYTNPISEKIINKIYMGVIKTTPGIWSYLYDNPRIVKRLEKIKQRVHKYNCPKLKNLFDKFMPDVVVCTQAFPCGMVADYKRTYGANFSLIAVLTDYIPHSYWVYDTVDYYITPSEEVSLQLIKKGIIAEKIKPFGIPFDPAFNQSTDKDEIRGELGLRRGIFTLLVMGGGQGLGPIKTIVTALEKVKTDLQIIIVTGANKKLYKSLKRKLKGFRKRAVLLGYANNIKDLMSISDVIITKPGGITTAEALSKGLPMLIIKPIPGQEVSNTRYLTDKLAAIKIDNPRNINIVVEELLRDPNRLKLMRQAASFISKPTASLDIAELLLDLK